MSSFLKTNSPAKTSARNRMNILYLRIIKNEYNIDFVENKTANKFNQYESVYSPYVKEL